MLADGNALGKGIRKQKKRLSKNLSTKKDNPFYFWVALFCSMNSSWNVYFLFIFIMPSVAITPQRITDTNMQTQVPKPVPSPTISIRSEPRNDANVHDTLVMNAFMSSLPLQMCMPTGPANMRMSHSHTAPGSANRAQNIPVMITPAGVRVMNPLNPVTGNATNDTANATVSHLVRILTSFSSIVM